MNTQDIWKAPFKIFSLAFFSLVSFIVLLGLFSLFFIGAGLGVGAVMGKSNFKDFRTVKESSYTYVSGDKESQNYLMAVSVEGLILGSPSGEMGSTMGWVGGVTYGYEVQKTLEQAAEDEKIKGIFIRMQTPGGTIFGSRAIFDGIKSFQEKTGKPVLVYIEGIAASGGVMAMIGADAIYADHGSMIGSIGVIGGMLTYYDKPTATQGGLFGGGVVTQGGIERTIISAGKGKDLGNPYRKATEEEIQNLQKGINIEYENFVNHVAQNRNIDQAVIREKMGAQIFDNKTAQNYGLIDDTLNRNASIARLAELAELDEDYQLVSPKRAGKKFLQELLLTFQDNTIQAQLEKQIIKNDICQSAAKVPLAYHGNIVKLCAECPENFIY
ncbi:Peptidase, S49 family [Desulfonema limicola]|uniref:Peptidase, S49 family n=1 Tax=Desulfonema limicola TaxID=45656 RepID=A0A975BCR2_9BACT|nr:S49 family peptidase [Desulfonema limicola]QTA82967.1 Peptidase, S49 family [Desulfonema limicola]